MKTYLVDFENVKSKGLSGIDRLTDKDHVIIFYSENSDTISFEMHCLVMQTKAQVDYMKVRVGGKNALDFQLSTLLGYLVAKGEDTHLFIISNDKGFDKLHDFWENTFADSPSCRVFRTSTISAAINYAQGGKKQTEAVQPQQVKAEAAAVPASAEPKVVEIEIKDAKGKSSSIDVPEAMVYSMIDGTDLTESIAPKRSEKTAPEKKRGRKPKAERQDEQSKQESSDRTDKKTEEANEMLPEMILPGSSHPLIAADEAHMAMYEPMFEEFLARPEAQDKHAILAGFMEGVPDADIDSVKELILASSCKLELHNMLMKQFDNETSTHYYTMIKKNYYFLKRVLPDAAAADAADKAAEQPKEAKAKQRRKKTDAKPEAKKSEANKKSKKASEEQSGDDGKQTVNNKKTAADKTAHEIKKVNAAMKKKLHELLDGNATPDEFSGVISVMNASATSQQLYINLMQRYSRTRGRELYRLVKDAYAEYISTAARTEKKPRSSVKQKQTEVADGEQRLRELTDGVIKPENFNDVYEAVLEANSVHRLYLGLIRRFGRSFGAQVYAAIKAEHEVIKAALTREGQG